MTDMAGAQAGARTDDAAQTPAAVSDSAALDDIIDAAMKASEGAKDGPETGPNTGPNTGPETGPETSKTVPANGARDLAPDHSSRADDGTAPVAPLEQDGADAETEARQAPEDPLAPPEDWREDQRARFAELPDDAKRLVLEQYKDFQAGYTRKSQALSAQARYAETLQAAFAPYRQQLNRAGIDEVAAVQNLIELSHLYSRDPIGYLHLVAGNAGIDLATLSAQIANGNDTGSHVAALNHRLRSLEGLIDGFIAPNAQPNSPAANAANVAQGGADPSRQPLHPALSQVAHAAGILMENHPGMTMDEAYRRAIEAQSGAKTGAASRDALDKARKAGRTIKSSAPAGGMTEPRDLDSILNDAMEKYGVA